MKKPFLYEIIRPVASIGIKLIYNGQVFNQRYLPKEGPFVIAGNHKHYWDPFFIDVFIKEPVYSLCAQMYYDKYKFILKNLGTIPVYEKSGSSALKAAIEYLKDKAIIQISPEGRRNKTSEIVLPFKKGAVIMAQQANCPIIPYAITGSYTFRSKDLHLTYGPPLDVSNMSVEEANQLLQNTVKQLILDNTNKN